MFTVTLAYINARYKYDNNFLFVFTFIIDIEIIDKVLTLI